MLGGIDEYFNSCHITDFISDYGMVEYPQSKERSDERMGVNDKKVERLNSETSAFQKISFFMEQQLEFNKDSKEETRQLQKVLLDVSNNLIGVTVALRDMREDTKESKENSQQAIKIANKALDRPDGLNTLYTSIGKFDVVYHGADHCHPKGIFAERVKYK